MKITLSLSQSGWKVDTFYQTCVDCRAIRDSPRFPNYVLSDYVQSKINPNNELVCPACAAVRCNNHGITQAAFRYTSGPFAQRD
ncbi:hypothetical protein YOLOSWAG_123 [Erwinia phage vB_EamM_Yoloswag]|uniref:Uncharacterized protein n=1 Tax=Erwinia phage vB_EamM_Yoloswag TaxID=1958956 RepID=A0A1S6L345_9CAUD|nr:hypothetical protein HOR66_gp123 [Erwinia phage vB_EamM_Yoloswag]AQT28604.1 hypothetical protein YOLOSWAG_123 [Erwinia phage vB_EamM_Yoloswag]